MEALQKTPSPSFGAPLSIKHWSCALEEFRHDNIDPRLVERNGIFHFSFSEIRSDQVYTKVAEDNPTVNGNTLFCVGDITALSFFVLSDKIEFCINGDPNLDQKLLWNLFLKSVKDTHSPSEAIDQFIAAFLAADFHDQKLIRFEAAIVLKTYLLSRISPFLIGGGYAKVKDAVTRGNIQLFCLNYKDLEGLKEFTRITRAKQIKARVVYASSSLVGFKESTLSKEALIRGMNVLAEPDKGNNVVFLLGAADIENKCSCTTKALGGFVTNHLIRQPELSCDKTLRHFNTLIDRIEYDFALFVITKFGPGVEVDAAYFKTKILDAHLNRLSVEHIRHSLETMKKHPQIEAAQDFYDKLYATTAIELGLDGIKRQLFLKGLIALFPEMAAKYALAPPNIKEITPEEVFIIEQVFAQIKQIVNELLSSS